jgi:ATP-dependent DNA ligase
MKAKPVTPRLIFALGPYCFAQPKLRGQRAHVSYPTEGEPVLVSSHGIPFSFLSHITEALSALPPLRYDGELYIHDPAFTQERLNSILNRTTNPHPDSSKIQFHIFDIISPEPQWERLIKRDQALANISPNSPIKKVPYEVIPTFLWQSQAQEYIAQGYEGIILRQDRGLYSPLDPLTQAKRPSCLLKFKPTERDEYLIVNYKEGTGQYANALGALCVSSPDGSGVFWVGTGPIFTKEQRFNLWPLRDSLLGQTLIVKHEPIRTVNNLPICTTAIKIVDRSPKCL